MIEEIDETDDADLAQADEMDDADLAQALALSMLKPSRQASDTYRLPSVIAQCGESTPRRQRAGS
jgi:hypothetical protein